LRGECKNGGSCRFSHGEEPPLKKKRICNSEEKEVAAEKILAQYSLQSHLKTSESRKEVKSTSRVKLNSRNNCSDSKNDKKSYIPDENKKKSDHQS